MSLIVTIPALMSRVFGGSSRCSGVRPSGSAAWSDESLTYVRLRLFKAATNRSNSLSVFRSYGDGFAAIVTAAVAVTAVSLLLSLEKLEEDLDVLSRCRRLAEQALESVIESALFDERLCVTELFPKGISIAAMQMCLD